MYDPELPPVPGEAQDATAEAQGLEADTLEDARRLPLVLNYELDDAGLTPDAMLVYVHLVRRAQAKGRAWPNYRSIGEHCFRRRSSASSASLRRRAMRAVAELLEARLITRKGRALADGSQSSNVYRLTSTDEWRHPR